MKTGVSPARPGASSGLVRSWMWVLPLCLLAALFGGCAGPSEGSSGVEPAATSSSDLKAVTLKSIAVTPAQSPFFVGSSQALMATGTFTDGSTQDFTTTATWTSSNPGVATVSATGLVTAVGSGSASITATSGTVKGKATVKVSLTLLSIAVTPGSATLPANTSQTLKATGTYDTQNTKNLTSTVTWASSQPGVATVSSAGVVLAVAPGTTTITASTSASSSAPIVGSATITVSSATITSVAVTPANKKLPNGTSQQFTATATFSDGTKQVLASPVVAWSSSATSVATVNASGVVTGVALGSATITAKPLSSAVTGTAKLTVTAATLASVAVTPVDTTVIAGESQQFAATGTYSDDSTLDVTTQVTWAAASPAVATIATGGLATAVAPGSTSITATDPKTKKAGTTTLSVTGAVLQSIALAPSPASLPAGTSAQLLATGTLSNGMTENVTSLVTWSSSSTAVAQVSNAAGSQGLVSGLVPGTATITAIDPTTGVTQSETVTVTSALLTRITVAPSSASVPVGTSAQLTAVATYSDGSTADVTQAVTWASGNASVLVSNAPGSSGQVTAVSAGSAVVSATDPSTQIAGQTTVTVTAAVLRSISIAPASASILRGATIAFTATGVYSDKSTETITAAVTWSSSGAAASVSNAAGSNGLATGTAVGPVTVTATDPTTGIAGSASLAVTAPVPLSLTLTPAIVTLLPAQTQQLRATLTLSDGTTADETTTAAWASSSPSIWVSTGPSGGLVTGSAVGTANVTATDATSGLVGSAAVTVSAGSGPLALAAGAFHTCALLANGTVECWGNNQNGQLGLGGTANSAVPVVIPNLSHVTALAAGAYHTCALLAGGTVTCWGDDEYGQVGGGAATPGAPYAIGDPVEVPNLAQVTALAAGQFHTCALLAGGTVSCWGYNGNGELGNGSTTSSLVPVAVPSLGGVTSLAAGGASLGSHTCALVSGGAVQCWGYNGAGELGDGATASSSSPVAVSNLSGVTSIAAHGERTCATGAGGSLECWGDNSNGGLGNGTFVSSAIPVAPSGLGPAVEAAPGNASTCALLAGGTVSCWGYNGNGELGNGTSANSEVPVAVPNLTGATALVSGDSDSCVVLSTGAIECWGSNGQGTLGNGTTANASTPVLVSGTSVGAEGVSAGAEHACQIQAGGQVTCWGANFSGQLGNGSTTNSATPVAVSSLSNAAAVAAGDQFTCAVLVNGTVECWGSNASGQLGNGTTTNASTPVAVPNLTGVVSISAGIESTCVALTSGTVECWGGNSNGELGNATATNSLVPVVVPNLTSAVSVSVGDYHVCAVLSGGTVDCWGYNYSGEVGNGAMGTTTPVDPPVPVLNLSGVIEVAAGGPSTCALLANGTVECWGYDLYGNLGNGATANSAIPVPVSGLNGATGLAVGDNDACAVVAAGAVECWGDASEGALGAGGSTGPSSQSDVPVNVLNLTGVATISAGDEYECAQLSSGAVSCWGESGNGTLGNGSTTGSSTPVGVALTCPSGYVVCGSACVDTQIDDQNCGACGTVCAAGVSCGSGECGCSGPSSEPCALCGTQTRTCVGGTNWSAWSACSGQGVCQANTSEVCDGNGIQVCSPTCSSWGKCRCQNGTTLCGSTCSFLQSDPNNCGSCGHACTTDDPNASGDTCQAGTCAVACNDGYTLCNGVCVNENTDSNNCGDCGVQCTTSDPNASGASCDGNGNCETVCNAGYVMCDGACVNESTDANNCGACDNACPAGCSGGVCGTAVTTTADSGPGSLRAAVASVTTGQAITFAPSLSGQTITLLSPISIARDVSLVGPGATSLTISGGGSVLMFSITSNAHVTMSGLTLTGGSSSSSGGAIYFNGPALAINACAFTYNTSSFGGGAIFGASAGTITVTGSSFANNSSTGSTWGGAIYAGGTLTVTASAFVANTAGNEGGAIVSFGPLSVPTVFATNSTFTQNSAPNGSAISGSGIVLVNDTVVANVGGPALDEQNLHAWGCELKGSIVSNGPGDLMGPGPFTSLDYNILGSTTGATFTGASHDQVGVSPGLDPLGGYGGPTLTMRVETTSPAYNFLPIASCTDANGNALTVDQRGSPRPSGYACDIGAFERQPSD